MKEKYDDEEHKIMLLRFNEAVAKKPEKFASGKATDKRLRKLARRILRENKANFKNTRSDDGIFGRLRLCRDAMLQGLRDGKAGGDTSLQELHRVLDKKRMQAQARSTLKKGGQQATQEQGGRQSEHLSDPPQLSPSELPDQAEQGVPGAGTHAHGQEGYSAQMQLQAPSYQSRVNPSSLQLYPTGANSVQPLQWAPGAAAPSPTPPNSQLESRDAQYTCLSQGDIDPYCPSISSDTCALAQSFQSIQQHEPHLNIQAPSLNRNSQPTALPYIGHAAMTRQLHSEAQSFWQQASLHRQQAETCEQQAICREQQADYLEQEQQAVQLGVQPVSGSMSHMQTPLVQQRNNAELAPFQAHVSADPQASFRNSVTSASTSSIGNTDMASMPGCASPLVSSVTAATVGRHLKPQMPALPVISMANLHSQMAAAQHPGAPTSGLQIGAQATSLLDHAHSIPEAPCTAAGGSPVDDWLNFDLGPLPNSLTHSLRPSADCLVDSDAKFVVSNSNSISPASLSTRYDGENAADWKATQQDAGDTYKGCVRILKNLDGMTCLALAAEVARLLKQAFAKASQDASLEVTLTLPKGVLVSSKAAGETVPCTKFGVSHQPVIESVMALAGEDRFVVTGHQLAASTMFATSRGQENVEYLEPLGLLRCVGPDLVLFPMPEKTIPVLQATRSMAGVPNAAQLAAWFQEPASQPSTAPLETVLVSAPKLASKCVEVQFQAQRGDCISAPYAVDTSAYRQASIQALHPTSEAQELPLEELSLQQDPYEATAPQLPPPSEVSESSMSQDAQFMASFEDMPRQCVVCDEAGCDHTDQQLDKDITGCQQPAMAHEPNCEMVPGIAARSSSVMQTWAPLACLHSSQAIQAWDNTSFILQTQAQASTGSKSCSASTSMLPDLQPEPAPMDTQDAQPLNAQVTQQFHETGSEASELSSMSDDGSCLTVDDGPRQPEDNAACASREPGVACRPDAEGSNDLQPELDYVKRNRVQGSHSWPLDREPWLVSSAEMQLLQEQSSPLHATSDPNKDTDVHELLPLPSPHKPSLLSIQPHTKLAAWTGTLRAWIERSQQQSSPLTARPHSDKAVDVDQLLPLHLPHIPRLVTQQRDKIGSRVSQPSSVSNLGAWLMTFGDGAQQPGHNAACALKGSGVACQADASTDDDSQAALDLCDHQWRGRVQFSHWIRSLPAWQIMYAGMQPLQQQSPSLHATSDPDKADQVGVVQLLLAYLPHKLSRSLPCPSSVMLDAPSAFEVTWAPAPRVMGSPAAPILAWINNELSGVLSNQLSQSQPRRAQTPRLATSASETTSGECKQLQALFPVHHFVHSWDQVPRLLGSPSLERVAPLTVGLAVCTATPSTRSTAFLSQGFPTEIILTVVVHGVRHDTTINISNRPASHLIQDVMTQGLRLLTGHHLAIRQTPLATFHASTAGLPAADHPEAHGVVPDGADAPIVQGTPLLSLRYTLAPDMLAATQLLKYIRDNLSYPQLIVESTPELLPRTHSDLQLQAQQQRCMSVPYTVDISALCQAKQVTVESLSSSKHPPPQPSLSAGLTGEASELQSVKPLLQSALEVLLKDAGILPATAPSAAARQRQQDQERAWRDCCATYLVDFDLEQADRKADRKWWRYLQAEIAKQHAGFDIGHPYQGGGHPLFPSQDGGIEVNSSSDAEAHGSVPGQAAEGVHTIGHGRIQRGIQENADCHDQIDQGQEPTDILEEL